MGKRRGREDLAGQARREAQERASQKAREPAEQHRRQATALSETVVFLAAVSLGLLLISTFGKVPLLVSVAVSAGLLYFGFASPHQARYHLGI